MNILSLFNGMSCGYMAAELAGLPINVYYSSEIDKHANKVTDYLFPDIIQIGDVRNIDISKLQPIDILIGGSPCQSFSFAGKRKGMSTKDSVEIYTLDHYLELKANGFEFEGQSYLFWEYMRILNDIRKYNPNVLFLLENVEMGEKWETILSKAIGIKGVHINSALVSAQSRKRIYWTNINKKRYGLFGFEYADIPQPKDRGILLKDILETDVAEKYYLSDKMMKYFSERAANFNNGKVNIIDDEDKATTLTKSYASYDISDNFVKIDRQGNPKQNQDKASCFTAGAHSGGNHSDMDLIREVKQLNPSNESGGKQPYQQNRVYDADGIAPALCAGKSDLLITENTIIDKSHQNEGIRYYNDKCPTLNARDYKQPREVLKNARIRRLTERECARLQTVPEPLIDKMLESGVSSTQLYKMLGNGWTIEVIAHILKQIPG